MSTSEWAQKTYNEQYEKWVPWIEDMYLRWFTKDNKASYVAKGTDNPVYSPACTTCSN
jgi:hypothetical protein